MRSKRVLNPAGDIAIVGIGGIFPGASSPAELWAHVAAGRSLAREVPAGRWPLAIADVYAPHLSPDHVYSTRGCFVDDLPADLTGLDISPGLYRRLDPMFHLLLYAGRAAWQDAVTTKIDKSRAGIIIGNIALPTDASSAITEELLGSLFDQKILGNAERSARKNIPRTDPLNRYVAGLPAGILARALGLTGGWFTLDAACASSLYALKLAADELRAGRADVMLTGGLSRPDCLYTQMGFSQLRALSPSGRCAPFDARADGLVVGEGAGILVLKRLADARAAGDRIYATLAGVGLSNDVAGNLMQPDSAGQLRAMRAAYRAANWSPADIDLIECHGTGTPIGDAVELKSLVALRDDAGGGGAKRNFPTVIGSVKSNVGHLLTAAGAAGLIKVLMAMRHQQLPPTANFESAAAALPFNDLRVLQQTEPWPRPANHPRRAAISGFGFGGINAHVLIEHWESENAKPHTAPRPTVELSTQQSPIAIVGLGTRFGPWQSLAAFRQRIFNADQTPPRPPAQAWGAPQSENATGHFIDDVAVPLGRFRIPPAELAEMLPQQLLMLQAAADAFDDANLGDAAVTGDRTDTGVFIGIALDLNTTNFRFRWLLQNRARAYAQSLGLALTHEQLAAWTNQLREAAGPALNANRTMGALGGIVASRVARAFHVAGPSFTLSSEETSATSALDIAVGMLQRNEINVALVGAVDLAGDPRAADGKADTVLGEGAGALVLKRHADALRDGDRIYALIDNVTPAPVPSSTPFTAAEDLGDTGAARDIASLIKAALALHHHTLPGPQHWLHDRADGPRRASVHSEGAEGNRRCINLTAVESADCPPPLALPEQILAASGTTTAELIANLDALAHLATSCTTISSLAIQWSTQNPPPASPAKNLHIALVIESLNQLPALLAHARTAIQSNTPLATDRIFFSPNPLARTGELALVFPGSGTVFPGMGRDLAAHFPQILHQQDRENQRLASQFTHGAFWQNENTDSDTTPTPRDAIFAQVCLGAFTADLLAAFNVTPRAAIGYSLGESTALFATRTWTARDEMFRRTHESSLFTTDLTGPCNSVRRAWNLPESESVDWTVGVINIPAATVREALNKIKNQRVYLLIVNAPSECVIGGDRSAVESLVRQLACRFHAVPGVTTVHCEVVRPVENAYRELHLLDTTPPANVRFYSGARGEAYAVTRESAADSIVCQAVAPFDFTKVIERAYADGVRLFLEAGPGATCTRMIDQILEGRPHLARSVCAAGADNVAIFLRVLAQLIAEGVPVNLAPLHASPDAHKLPADAKYISVATGGAPFEVPPPPVPHRPARIAPALEIAAQPAALWQPLIDQMAASQIAHAQAQQAFLRLAESHTTAVGHALSMQLSLLSNTTTALLEALPETSTTSPVLDRAACLEFAIGKLQNVLGDAFAHVDAYPTRVRLPDEPLMLVDRITHIDGQANSMSAGRVITEHDIHENAWYLDANRIPTCIAVEAGQADLFLSGYLGIDSITKGRAVYRLLDAVVTFHDSLPGPGETIIYDIAIEHFFRQGDTHLFRFHFDATVNGRPFLTMHKGCAGFFTAEELAAGQGIVLTSIDKRPTPGRRTPDYAELVPMKVESYSDTQLNALRHGDLEACFGPAFATPQSKIKNQKSKMSFLPAGRMTLVHRILSLNPTAGKYGLGQITGEADIRPDDWFLTCHFVDDRVMPGTLMYECCLHSLRVYLLRMGWVPTSADVAYEPIPEVSSQLKCRGQVTAQTKKVRYEVTLKEIGYQPDGTPYVIADALMSADGKPIVQMLNMSTKLTGLTREVVQSLWNDNAEKALRHKGTKALRGISATLSASVPQCLSASPIFDTPRITAFALGKPSEAFGDPYKIFDPGQPRKIARLPGPPYQFLDRITRIENAEPFKLAPGAQIEAQYDVPPDAWYFQANSQPPIPNTLYPIPSVEMPFSILLEIALQPCGWLAAYLGSALTSATDLKFRNLGGAATWFLPVTPATGTLTTHTKITNVSHSGGMIIQHFDIRVSSAQGDVYRGTTYFGFFSKGALANQVGIRDAALYQPTDAEIARAQSFDYPTGAPFPNRQMCMVDRIDHFDPAGGPNHLGYIRGSTTVDPAAWFFKAHFFEDPVWPGSLGLESFLQLLKVFAHRRGMGVPPMIPTSRGAPSLPTFQTPTRNQNHAWIYRGQILPTDSRVTVEALITHIDDATHTLRADGFLTVDNRTIYQMKDFSLTFHPGGGVNP